MVNLLLLRKLNYMQDTGYFEKSMTLVWQKKALKLKQLQWTAHRVSIYYKEEMSRGDGVLLTKEFFVSQASRGPGAGKTYIFMVMAAA